MLVFLQGDTAKKLFPCLTIRSLAPYKKRGFFYDLDEFQENTFTLNDIFDNETVQNLKNLSLFHLKEINSYVHGKCFSLCPQTWLDLDEIISLPIKNERNVEILVYLEGEEFWLIFPRFPSDVGSTRIESNNRDQLVSVDVKV
jgi:hypothetical protein